MTRSFTHLLWASSFIVLTLLACKTSSGITKDDSSLTIAFGSCNHQWDDQGIWNEVVKNSPDVWIWLGDIIYADTEDMTKLEDDYGTQKSNADYQTLLNQTEHVIGIWDDHDYGANNAGKEYSKKDSSRNLLFDFLDIPISDTLWYQKGAYQSHTFDQNGLSVKVVLLDVRYFRDDPEQPQGSILGKEQWNWLVSELSESSADIHIIGGGIQFLPEDHPFEKWANFPTERQRLLQVIDALNVSNPILISGDRHIAEMSLVELPVSKSPILEVTSSGLTHYYSDFTSEENKHRIGSAMPMINFGLLHISKRGEQVQFEAQIRNGSNKVQYSVKNGQLTGLLNKMKSKL